MTHDDVEAQLSAYLDGELDERARAEVEAHLAGCPACRRTLDALRATLSELGDLSAERPEPSEQETWALRMSIDRARRGRAETAARGIARFAPAIAAAAAALVAVVAVVGRPHDGGGLAAGADKGAQRTVAAEDPLALQIIDSGLAYDQASVALRLDSLAFPTVAATAPLTAPGTGAGAPGTAPGGTAPPLPPEVDSYAASSLDANVLEAIEACAAKARAGKNDLEPILYEVATFRGQRAYLIAFRAPDHYEMWVFSREGCDTLYFRQRKA